MKCDGNEIQVDILSSLINSFEKLFVIYSLHEVEYIENHKHYIGILKQGAKSFYEGCYQTAKLKYGLKPFCMFWSSVNVK